MSQDAPASALSRPVAAFDMDGTLFRWTLAIAHLDAMVARGIVPRDRVASIEALREAWVAREKSYTEFMDHYVQRLEEGLLKGISAHVFTEIAQDVVRAGGCRVYVFTRELLFTLREEGYVLAAISGSPIQIVNEFCARWKFDHVFGTVEEVGSDGLFTGDRARADLPVFRKEKEFSVLIEQYGSHEDSVAIGDTFGDVPMLSMARFPIAFNPDQKLKRFACQNGFGDVNERKDSITCTRRLQPASLTGLLPPAVARRLLERLHGCGITPFEELRFV